MSGNKNLCTALLNADSGDEVIKLLKTHGYWDKPPLWRHYGDVENNWGQSGNQQSLPEAALAEKIVNSVDARLINECRMRRIKPSSAEAPQTMRAAVAHFFENSSGDKIATGGMIEDWSDARTREIAEGITLTATGTRPKGLNLTIADCGEGQSPDRLPETILSLSKSNKQCIPFVQGKFNQGGTGALRFCGEHNLQLVISKRNPKFLDDNARPRDHEWSFTIVRREIPTGEPGTSQSSMYTYLAPVDVGEDVEDRQGGVLSFDAQTFAIYPDDENPYGREADYGTAIKLYDYQYSGDRSHILRGKRGSSLLSRINLLLPEIALPVRLYEYRKNKAGKYHDVGSRRTTLNGLLRRIKDNPNVENGFPVRLPFQPDGKKLIANVFAFVPEGSDADQGDEKDDKKTKKRGGIQSYRRSEGVVFVRGGQTQGTFPKDFFGRDAVKMKPIKDELLVFVECDDLDIVTGENLFMASRDRLTNDKFKRSLVESLETALRDCPELRALRSKRQQERTQERLKDDKPLNDVLQSIIKSSPNLTTLLKLGQRISAPFNTVPTGKADNEDFKGEVYPTFFKNKGVEYGEALSRSCPINNRMRLTFETDAQNNYFTRAAERGEFDLTWKGSDGSEFKASPIGPNLKNGIATVTVDLPSGASIGDEIEFIAQTRDAHRTFKNRIKVAVTPQVEKTSGGSGGRKPPKKEEGDERERPSELEPPDIQTVYRKEWKDEGFDEHTAMKIKTKYSDDDKKEYVFKVNMDNMPLESEAKMKRLSNDNFQLLQRQFTYANVLIGLSMILEEKRAKKNEIENEDIDKPPEDIEKRVEQTCRSLAPFIPALISLGARDLESDDTIEGLEETG